MSSHVSLLATLFCIALHKNYLSLGDTLYLVATAVIILTQTKRNADLSLAILSQAWTRPCLFNTAEDRLPLSTVSYWRFRDKRRKLYLRWQFTTGSRCGLILVNLSAQCLVHLCAALASLHKQLGKLQTWFPLSKMRAPERAKSLHFSLSMAIWDLFLPRMIDRMSTPFKDKAIPPMKMNMSSAQSRQTYLNIVIQHHTLTKV